MVEIERHRRSVYLSDDSPHRSDNPHPFCRRPRWLNCMGSWWVLLFRLPACSALLRRVIVFFVPNSVWVAHETVLELTNGSRASPHWSDAGDLLGGRVKRESLLSPGIFLGVPDGSCGVVQEQEGPLLLVVLLA